MRSDPWVLSEMPGAVRMAKREPNLRKISRMHALRQCLHCGMRCGYKLLKYLIK